MPITKEQTIYEIVGEYPETRDVFRKHGLGCLGCVAARFENLAEGAQAHGIDIDVLVADLNAAIIVKEQSIKEPQ